MQLIRVGIVEDNKAFRTSLEHIVSTSYILVFSLPHAERLSEVLKETPCDVLLLDIRLPGTSGLESLKVVRRQFPEIRILMQTVMDDDDSILQAICYGASGYLLKLASAADYTTAIHDSFYGGAPLTPGVAAKILKLFHRNQEVRKDYGLTERETEVLKYLVEGHSYKMIAAACGIGYDTVRFHMKNIYAKLQVESMTEAVSIAIRQKLI